MPVPHLCHSNDMGSIEHRIDSNDFFTTQSVLDGVHAFGASIQHRNSNQSFIYGFGRIIQFIELDV